MPENYCIDLQNHRPEYFRYDSPEWSTQENALCRPELELDEEGECIQHLNLANDCKAYCEQSWAWFYGLPTDISVWGHQNLCQRNDPCSINIQLSWTPGEVTVQTRIDDRTLSSQHGESKRHSWTNTWALSKTFSADFDSVSGSTAGEAAMDPSQYGLGVKLSAGFQWQLSRRKAREESKSLAHSWESTVQRYQKYGIMRTRSSSVGLGSGGSFPKPNWASDYCGSWYAVPVVGLSCGRAAVGELIMNSQNETQCSIDYGVGVFDTCVDYLFEQPNIPEATRSKMVYVLKDCEHHFILPGEWQDPAFAASIGNMQEFEKDHLSRFGHGKSRHKKRPDDALWTSQRRGMGTQDFTKTIGPADDYNFMYCGRGDYCVRHKLSKGNCYDIPRNYISPSKSAHVVSASVRRGTCCVLFSRHQCQGQAQLVKGNITDLETVGFDGMAHSVVCDVDEYCDPYRREASDYDGAFPIFIKDSTPWIQPPNGQT
ncbi:hypothetical protein QBC44DRAFT_290601 [Cladorrhinum sp. PSN332]|nr:hypothetical protein QBC44DRAFT_290601 [Cladorrhinum sp. PSN332]